MEDYGTTVDVQVTTYAIRSVQALEIPRLASRKARNSRFNCPWLLSQTFHKNLVSYETGSRV